MNCKKKIKLQFKKFKMIVLDVNALIAGTSYRGDAEERIKDLIQFLKDNHDVILFIDEVHTILGAGSCFEGEMDLANALKPILARGDTIVLGATTQEEYEKYFQRDGALSRRFEKVIVKEPLAHNVYPMIKNKIAILSDFHKVTISKDIVNYAVMIVCCFAFGVSAEESVPDGLVYTVDTDSVTVTGYTGKEAKIIIPSTYSGLPVTHIASNAFESCITLTAVTIPESITTIGRGAFKDCANLISVTIPDNVTTMEQDAFAYCANLETV